MHILAAFILLSAIVLLAVLDAAFVALLVLPKREERTSAHSRKELDEIRRQMMLGD